MAHPAFDLEVITPEGSALRERVTSVRLPGTDGSFGILARHAPLVAALEPGLLLVEREDGRREPYAVGEGFVEVRTTGVRVLVDSCEAKNEIDVGRAERAKERAKERLKEHDAQKVDAARAEASLRRAIARLSVATFAGLAGAD